MKPHPLDETSIFSERLITKSKDFFLWLMSTKLIHNKDIGDLCVDLVWLNC